MFYSKNNKACAIHCVERADIQFADVVVVSGCGPLGLGIFKMFFFDEKISESTQIFFLS